jgi:hypothetical protein
MIFILPFYLLAVVTGAFWMKFRRVSRKKTVCGGVEPQVVMLTVLAATGN